MGIIRLLLALSVVAIHTSPILGYRLIDPVMAVEGFFIISGFYMSLILNEKYNKPGSYKLFITNRLLRIFPAYWVVLFLTLLLSFLVDGMFADSYRLINKDVVGVFSWLMVGFSNMFIVGIDFFNFLQIDPTTKFFTFTDDFSSVDISLRPDLLMVIPPAWSLSIELFFYFLAPLIVRRKLSTIVTIMLSMLTLRFMIFSFGYANDPWSHRVFPFELALFLLGCVSYHIYKKLNTPKPWHHLLTGIVVVIILFYGILPKSLTTPLLFYLILMIAIPFSFNASKSLRFDRVIGELSYPVYISHIMFLMLFDHFIPDKNIYWGPLVAFASILFSLLLMKYVIDPIEIYRQGRIKNLKQIGEKASI